MYGGPQLSRQIQIHRGKFKFTTAGSNSPRQIQIRHGKFKFTTANLKFTAANSKSLLSVRFAIGVGHVLGLVLVVRASFCEKIRVYWVSEVADLRLLPLLVGMGDS